MNPIASSTTATAPREGAFVDPKSRQVNETAGTAPVQPVAPPDLAAAVRPSDEAEAKDAAEARRLAEESARADAARRADREDGEEIVPAVDEPRPVPPLKSFANIPMQVVEEISKIREEAAKENAEGANGRPDPTPVPAADQAIAPTPPGSAV